MAFSIEILGIRWEGGQYALERMTADVGSARELMRDPRFRNLSSQAGYLDVVAVLSVNEALSMARAAADRAGAPPASAGISAFEESLADAAFVLVHIFEWESGL